MAAAEAWRARVRERAREAADRCQRAYILISDSGQVLSLPIRVADGDAGRARAMVAEDLLVEASTNLAVAASLLMAAGNVGLRGAAPNPAEPLPSFTDIAGVDEPDRNLRTALEQLRDARVGADSAWVSVQRCRGRLRTADQLLNHERLPGVDGFLDQERVAARGDLAAAWQLASESFELARAPTVRVSYLAP